MTSIAINLGNEGEDLPAYAHVHKHRETTLDDTVYDIWDLQQITQNYKTGRFDCFDARNSVPPP